MDIIGAILADPNIDASFKGAMAAQAADQAALPVRRARYVSALIRMDWSFEFSDDHAVWQRGRDELTRLRAERDAIDPDRALWNQHAHPNYRHG